MLKICADIADIDTINVTSKRFNIKNLIRTNMHSLRE